MKTERMLRREKIISRATDQMMKATKDLMECRQKYCKNTPFDCKEANNSLRGEAFKDHCNKERHAQMSAMFYYNLTIQKRFYDR